VPRFVKIREDNLRNQIDAERQTECSHQPQTQAGRAWLRPAGYIMIAAAGSRHVYADSYHLYSLYYVLLPARYEWTGVYLGDTPNGRKFCLKVPCGNGETR
jgi:hypothetical protein